MNKNVASKKFFTPEFLELLPEEPINFTMLKEKFSESKKFSGPGAHPINLKITQKMIEDLIFHRYKLFVLAQLSRQLNRN